MARVTVLDDVLVALRAGVAVDRVAGRLGLDPGVADVAVDHWRRLGVLVDADPACRGCGTDGPPRDDAGRAVPACAGCPLSRRPASPPGNGVRRRPASP